MSQCFDSSLSFFVSCLLSLAVLTITTNNRPIQIVMAAANNGSGTTPLDYSRFLHLLTEHSTLPAKPGMGSSNGFGRGGVGQQQQQQGNSDDENTANGNGTGGRGGGGGGGPTNRFAALGASAAHQHFDFNSNSNHLQLQPLPPPPLQQPQQQQQQHAILSEGGEGGSKGKGGGGSKVAPSAQHQQPVALFKEAVGSLDQEKGLLDLSKQVDYRYHHHPSLKEW